MSNDFQEPGLTDPSKQQLERITKDKTDQLKIIRHAPTFGFDNVVADAVFIQFLQYFGDTEVRNQTSYAASPIFFETLLSHDPSYRDFYLFLSGSSTIHAANPERTVELISKSLQETAPNEPSDSYYIWRYKAVDELLFLGDGESAQKSFATAADWAAQSQDPTAEQVGEISRRTANFLLDNPASRVAQIDSWSSLLSTALDKNTQTRAIEKIESLGGSVLISEDGEISIQYEKAEESERERESDI